MKNKEINELQRKRTNLKMRIRKWRESGKNAIELVKEYQEIVNKLISLGVKADIKTDYLKIEYWNRKTFPCRKTESDTSSLNQQHTYTLNLAWVETNNSTPVQVQKVKDYFKDLCLKCIGEDITNVPSGTEHVLRYEFEGVEESFRLLKICTQFVLDSFAQSDFDKFNIAVFGKKRPY